MESQPWENRMQLKLITALCSLALASVCMAQVRTVAPPDNQPKLRELAPTATFDKAKAEAALAEGNATIKGRACSLVLSSNFVYWPLDTEVRLYPATPYYDEMFGLIMKLDTAKEKLAPVPDEVINTYIKSMTDNKGYFQFPQVRAGRYWMYAYHQFDRRISREVYAGHSTDGVDSADHYQTQIQTVAQSNELIREIEVKKDGDTVNTVLYQGSLTARASLNERATLKLRGNSVCNSNNKRLN
jgi:hypothetical protein